MKKILLLVIGLVASVTVWGQSISFGLGDATLETSLNQVNVSAKADLGGFTAEVSLQWGIPEAQVKAVLTPDLQPAEVYLAAALANLSNQPISVVVTKYKQNRQAGWGALARSLGIRPGSPAFKALMDKSKATAAKRGGRK